MIVCVSANPAIDRRVRLDRLTLGSVNRAAATDSFAGGKAAHVAMAAKALGEEPVWIGFLGGPTGDHLEGQLNDLGIRTVAVRTASRTRSNDEIIEGDGTITEILEPGGEVRADELAEMFRVCEDHMQAAAAEGFCLVLSGSQPPGVPDDFYSELTLTARKYRGTVIVDTSGKALQESLKTKPDVIKPNREEAEKVVGFRIDGEKAAAKAVRQLQAKGISEVALSLGSEGIVWSSKNGLLIARPPHVEVISTVGCGDASVAGLAVSRIRGLGAEDTVCLAVACGAANCLAPLPGQIDAADVDRLTPRVEIESISEEVSATY